MNLYLTGSGEFGVMAAAALTSAGHTIAGAASPPHRRHRGHTDGVMGWDRLRAHCALHSIPWTPALELRARHIPHHTGLIVAAHSHAFIGRHTRARAQHGAVGYHPSLLPLHRGRDAVRWTIRDQDRVTGGTVYKLTDRVDAGPVCAQQHVLVPPGATASSLWRELLAPLGVQLLVQVAADLAAGRVVEVPQDERMATWEPALDPPRLPRPELPQLAAGPHTGTPTLTTPADLWNQTPTRGETQQ